MDGRAKVTTDKVSRMPRACFRNGLDRLSVDSLPAPPAPGTQAQKADEAAVLEWCAKRTDADCAGADATFYVKTSFTMTVSRR